MTLAAAEAATTWPDVAVIAAMIAGFVATIWILFRS